MIGCIAGCIRCMLPLPLPSKCLQASSCFSHCASLLRLLRTTTNLTDRPDPPGQAGTAGHEGGRRQAWRRGRGGGKTSRGAPGGGLFARNKWGLLFFAILGTRNVELTLHTTRTRSDEDALGRRCCALIAHAIIISVVHRHTARARLSARHHLAGARSCTSGSSAAALRCCTRPRRHASHGCRASRRRRRRRRPYARHRRDCPSR